MRIRKDLGGCVYVQGQRLFAGDPVPEGAVVSDWLLEDGPAEINTDSIPNKDEDQGQEVPKDEQTEEEQSNDEDEQKPSRNASKADWFAYAESIGVTEEDATIEDYTKDNLIELVG